MMKINKLTLKNMLIAAGLSLAFGCERKPVAESIQPNNPGKPTLISNEQTQPLPIEYKPSLPAPTEPLNISKDYCPPCGRG